MALNSSRDKKRTINAFSQTDNKPLNKNNALSKHFVVFIFYRYLQHWVEISNYQSNLLDYFRSNPYSREKQRKIVTSFNKKSRFLLQQIDKYQSFSNYELIKHGLN